MDFLKIKLLSNGLVYILQGKPGMTFESWLEPELAVEFIAHLVKKGKR